MPKISGKLAGKIKLSDWIIAQSESGIDWEPEVEIWISKENVYQVHRPSKKVRVAKVLPHSATPYGEWRTDFEMPDTEITVK